MADLKPDYEEAWAWYWVDVHRLVELSQVITWSFEVLVLLLVEQLPMLILGDPGTGSSDEEGMGNVGERHV